MDLKIRSHCHTIVHLDTAHMPTRKEAKDRGCALHISARATAVLSFRMVDTDEITCLISCRFISERLAVAEHDLALETDDEPHDVR